MSSRKTYGSDNDPSQFFSLNRLAKILKINKDKLYANMRGRRYTLTDSERDQVFDILQDALTDMRKNCTP